MRATAAIRPARGPLWKGHAKSVSAGGERDNPTVCPRQLAADWVALAAEAAASSDFGDGRACHDRWMLKLAVRHLRPDQVELLCEWFTHIQTVRRGEAMATLIDETVSHETAILIPNDGQPILVYAMEVDDPVQAQASAESGRHPIDAEHRAVLGAAVLGVPEQETVLDLRVDA